MRHGGNATRLVLAAAALAVAAAGCGVEARERKSVAELQREQLAKLAHNQVERMHRDDVRSTGSGARAVDGVFAWPDPREERPVAVLRVAGFGALHVALYPEIAPRTVERFRTLAGERFYDGIAFHRVVPGFVVQAGDPNTTNDDPRDDGMGGSGRPLPDEFSDAPLVRGVVAMANRGAIGTADSQFFVLLADRRDLDGRYTVFGRVVAGMDVAEAIARVETDRYGRSGPRERPLEPVLIETLRIEQAAPAAIAAREGAKAEAWARAEGPSGTEPAGPDRAALPAGQEPPAS